MILTFVGITVVLYGLVFFTPGSRTPKLGIDLQGGTRVTLQAQTADGSDPSRSSMTQARDIMERRVNGSGVVGAQVQVDGASQLVVTVPGEANLDNLTRSARMNIRPVIAGYPTAPQVTPTTGTGTSGSGTAPSGTATTGSSAPSSTGSPSPGASTTPKSPTAEVGNGGKSSSASGTRTATSSPGQGLRSPAMAVATTAPGSGESSAPGTEPGSTQASSTATSSTDTASTDSSQTAATGATTSRTAKATDFPAGSDPAVPTQPAGTDKGAWTTWGTAVQTSLATGAITCNDLDPYLGLDDPAKPLISCEQDGTAIYLLDATLVAGDQIDNATAGLSSNGSGWAVNVTFKGDGFRTWSNYTTANVGKQTAFTLDGQVLSAPSIRQPITTTTTEVSGSFNQTSATALANSLKFGALPLQFTTDKVEKVSAELGLESLRAGLIAGGIGLLLVVIYCLLYYRLLGLITILSLVLSGILVYGVMVLLGRWIDLSLDMAGIAGLIIAIGITADSFVVYFERLKDEVREGRTFRSAVPRGWERAKRTILSADAVTFLSAVILYLLAVGDVRGFAFTLGLSTVLDLVVVFLVTHPLVALASGSKVFTSPTYSGLGAVAAAGARHRAATGRLTTTEA